MKLLTEILKVSHMLHYSGGRESGNDLCMLLLITEKG